MEHTVEIKIKLNVVLRFPDDMVGELQHTLRHMDTNGLGDRVMTAAGKELGRGLQDMLGAEVNIKEGPEDEKTTDTV